MRVVSLDAFKESLVEELGNKVAFTVPVLGCALAEGTAIFGFITALLVIFMG